MKKKWIIIHTGLEVVIRPATESESAGEVSAAHCQIFSSFGAAKREAIKICKTQLNLARLSYYKVQKTLMRNFKVVQEQLPL